MKEIKTVLIDKQDLSKSFTKDDLEDLGTVFNHIKDGIYTKVVNNDVVLLDYDDEFYVVKNRHGTNGKVVPVRLVSTVAPSNVNRISIPQAKKFFYDWLDRNRPWNKTENKNDMYAYMEDLVTHAAMCFTREPLPTQDEINRLEGCIRELTANLSYHPKDYEGPCMCQECCNGD